MTSTGSISEIAMDLMVNEGQTQLRQVREQLVMRRVFLHRFKHSYTSDQLQLEQGSSHGAKFDRLKESGKEESRILA